MNATVFRRGLAEQWRGLLITAASVGSMLVFGLAVYRSIDLSFYDSLPEAVRAIMGIPAHADASLMAYNEMLAAIGALAFTGVAVAIGANAVAGDEEQGRLSLALSAPVSRVAFAVSKAVAMVISILLGAALLWGVAALAPLPLGVDTGDARVAALMLHLCANGLFHGALAFALATGTGRKGLGAGVGAGVMVAGWLGSSLLPMWREGAGDWVPWSWFNGTKPLVNGVDPGNLSLLLGGTALLLVVGVFGFTRRELRTVAASSLLDRLRELPRVGQLLQPTGRGRSLLAIRLAAHQVLVAYVAFLLAGLMGLAMPPLYNALKDSIGPLAATFPQSMADLFGGGDMSTAAGFLHLETFGMVAPLCVILVVTAAASASLAGEEKAGRMSVLLAQPIGRTRVYGVAALAVAVFSCAISGLLFLGMWAGLALAHVEVSLTNLAWACGLLALLGLLFGYFALLLSAATGRTTVAVWGSTAVAVGSFFGFTLLLASGNQGLGFWSPFAAYLTGPPLAVGVEWWQPVWLAVGALVCLGLGLLFWLRRDIRSGRG